MAAFLPWVFCVSALLYLISLTATWIGDGPHWTMLPAAFGLVGLVWFGAHFAVHVPRCRRYLTTTALPTGGRTDGAHPDRS